MDREQWKAVWRMMRVRKRELAEQARLEHERRRAEWGGSDEYEFRFVSYPVLTWGRS